ncbi:hypothetical protein [Agrobacterium larrymoorei]|uniref:Uncharacterized protein n=1 Tax=Agrobacterium larrymoorei TaxID=160699 RepID=A0ABU0UE07_9HYPH|nr:hypothetical protein [Agrobacterium larrymoorei]MDQ1183164.1 hypothetical protein [Agrobacterium larrymoorei]
MANKGGKISDETKAKISASQKARWERIRQKIAIADAPGALLNYLRHETAPWFRHDGDVVRTVTQSKAVLITDLIQRFRRWIKN